MIDSIIAEIRAGNSEQAIVLLEKIKAGNRGHEKLGDPESVVIKYPTHSSERVMDSVRQYTQAFFGGEHSARNLRVTAMGCGSDAVKVMPDWFKKLTGHVSVEGYAYLLYQTLVEVELNEANLDSLKEPYPSNEAIKRENLLWDGKIKTIDAPIDSSKESA